MNNTLTLQQQVQFQATVFAGNKLDFVCAVRLLVKQESWKPERICKDLNRYVSNYGLTFGFNKANRMCIIKGLDGSILFQATGDVGQHMFGLMVSKLSCK